ncbi:MAG: radical SAM protein [Deltaproteobacteria bacterium]|nr:radical SAM protein [Deltaproteobacteria bacterium]
MCLREEVDVEKASMLAAEFEEILKKFPKVKYLSLVGLGETLMYPYLPEIMRGIKDRDKNTQIVITTNGTLLTEENIQKINGISRAYISIDSVDPERYRDIRGVELREVADGVRRLRKNMPNILLFIQVVMMKDNLTDLPDFPRFAKEVGADGVSLLHIVPLNNEQDKMHLMYAENAKFYLDKAVASAREMGLELSLRPLLPKEKYCGYPWTTTNITLKGDIYACGFMCRNEEETTKEFYMGEPIDVPNYQYKVGNIFRDDFRKIWNGPDMQLLRKKLAGYWGGGRELSPEEFLKKRRQADLSQRFSYCDICLFRWGCAC